MCDLLVLFRIVVVCGVFDVGVWVFVVVFVVVGVGGWIVVGWVLVMFVCVLLVVVSVGVGIVVLWYVVCIEIDWWLFVVLVWMVGDDGVVDDGFVVFDCVFVDLGWIDVVKVGCMFDVCVCGVVGLCWVVVLVVIV